MYRNMLSVGGFTLLSRLTGFFRDMMQAAFLGGGGLNDAYVAAFKLPNQFRQIFAEGAFNPAYVPSYSRVLQTEGREEAGRFASQVFTLLVLSQIVLIALVYLDTPLLVRLTSPGWVTQPDKFDRAVEMTRVMFPYLGFITIVSLHQGTLNANGAFAAAAFAPVLLNLCVIGFVSVSFFFPDAADAASWGVVVSGILQLALVMAAARRRGLLERLTRPRLTADVRQFFSALGPAVIGSAGVQIAILADQIVGSLLPTGSVSAISYADRLYQLPIGVISIAAGTVLLPEMSRLLARGDHAGALHAQNRAASLTLALGAPFFVAFLLIPDLIMSAAFQRGAFHAPAAHEAASVLAAYAVGLPAVVVIRSALASFQARGDTTTPMIVSLGAIAINVGLKFALYRPLGAPGVALATAVGVWINVIVLFALGRWRGWTRPDYGFVASAAATLFASGALALAIPLLETRLAALVAPLPRFARESEMILLALSSALVYFAALALGLWATGIAPRGMLGRLARPFRRRNRAVVEGA